MRKTFIMGLGLALSLAGTAAAQQQGGAEQSRRPRPERAQRGGDQAGDRRFGGRGGPQGLLLKGITLTDAQKSQLKQLRDAQREKMQANREAGRKQFEDLRAARERGDTAAVRVAMEKNRAVMEQQRAQEMAAMRNILTAEQRVQFDKNVAELKARRPDGARGERRAERKVGR